MTISDRLLQQVKASRKELITQLNMMETGDSRTYSGGTDTTSESIKRVRGWITILDAVIGGIEADHAQDAAKRLGMHSV